MRERKDERRRLRASSRRRVASSAAARWPRVACCGGDGDARSSAVRPRPTRAGQRVASMSQRRSYIAARAARRPDLRGRRDGGGDRPAARDVLPLRPARDTWTELPPLPEADARRGGGRARRAASTSRAGRRRRGTSRPCSPWTRGRGAGGRWRRCRPRVFNHAARRARREALYALGGFAPRHESGATSTCTTRRRDRWRSRTPLPRPTHAFGAVAFRGELWVDRRPARRGAAARGLDPRSRAPAAGARARRCRSRWSCSAPRSPGDELHAVWESTYQVYDRASGRWRRRPGAARHAPRAPGLRDRREPLHRRRLHDCAPRQPGRRAALPGTSLSDPGRSPKTFRCLAFARRCRDASPGQAPTGPVPVGLQARDASRSRAAGPRSCPRRSRGSSGRGRGGRWGTRP